MPKSMQVKLFTELQPGDEIYMSHQIYQITEMHESGFRWVNAINEDESGLAENIKTEAAFVVLL